MVNIEKVSKEVASELGLDSNFVEQIARLQFRYIKDCFLRADQKSIILIHLGKFIMKENKSIAIDNMEPSIIDHLNFIRNNGRDI